MLEDVVLTKEEFKKLDLRKTGNYDKNTIYRGSDNRIAYFLHMEYDDGIGNYYRGSKLTFIESVNDNYIKAEKICLEINEVSNKHKEYCLKRKSGKWDGTEE